ncbi:cell wall-binding protein [Clostridium botulinum]|uniref:cell wall-binding protein n=1 Tax=Clostridium botulinum TaxID=1491 RepID=UPI000596B149|nr:cell wall-binding protein [Clostridium botulinum]KIL07004.1 cell wall-binding protein [Clostridium botulinum]MBY6935184.1 N-acetylmuramoyl-L-alanine amidase family protein [Clostridium botulinum]NFL84595.1 N-acetylmuramoyl-L-alanine amidase family protein [Clostridium botulinum]NFN12767.1 N-acetylmuramoyl-L-alanine amidase family protein [Clostridium botulinum]NFO38447.1 N-acetylmuramoyl-L-alanine amidase family protein [Clostridium botulinum]
MYLLFLISLICFVVGLIKPEKMVFWKEPSNRTKKDVLKYLGTLTAILFVLVGLFNSNSSSQTTATNKKLDNNTTQTESIIKVDEDAKVKSEQPKEIKKTGWIEENKNWYYYDNDGKQKTGWLTDNNKYYYFNASGVMQKDWIKDQGKDYFLDSNGVMQTGWKESNGKWYYLNSNGSMATNTTVDGYEVASNGVMQEKKVVKQVEQNNTSNSNNNVVETGDEQGETAYLSATGEKYHSRPDCGRMNPNKAIKTTVNKAKQNHKACSKCW